MGESSTVYGPFDRAVRYPVWLGIVLLSSGFTLHYLGVQAVRDLGMEGVRLFEPTPVVLNLQPDPAAPDLFGAELFFGVFRAVYAAASTFGLLMTVIGVFSIVVGLANVRRRGVARTTGLLVEFLTDPRRAAALAGAFVFALALVTSPLLRTIVTNLLTFALVSIPVFVVTSLSVVRLERRAGPATTVLLIGPLTVATVFLSVIVGVFASPATVVFMRRLTAGLVRFLLVNVFAVVGLDRLLVRAFELQGIGFLAFWVVVDVLVGIVFGLAILRYRAVPVQRVAG